MEAVDEANSKPIPANEPEHDLYTIPSYSIWFSWDDIHETEKSSLKEFFDGSSISRTPKIYKEYRDFIINKYREDPSRKLTFTEIRKSLIGDVNFIRKLFLFLEKWGLINFHTSPLTDTVTSTVVVENEEEKVKVKIEEGAPNGIRVVATPNSSKLASLPQNAHEVVESVENSFKLPPLASYTDVFGDLIRQKDLVCGICGGDCLSGFYENHKEGGLIICVKCFKDHSKSKPADDFEFHDCKVSLNNHGVSIWTEEETLRLLESVVNHGDDWNLVAQHVRTKNKSACISRLLQLPFGEFMLDMSNGKGDENSSSDTPNVKMHESTSVKLDEAIREENQHHEHINEMKLIEEGETGEPPSKRRCFATLADSGNSLMKQLALLSAAMGQHVEAAAAEAAITAIGDENPYARMMIKGEDSRVATAPSPLMKSELHGAPEVEDTEMGENGMDSEAQETTSERDHVPVKLRIRAAIATALGSAASHAKLLADQEDREMELLLAAIIEKQLRKVECKIKHFEELELIMEKEYTHIQEQKESIISEWIDVLRQGFSLGITRWRDRTSAKLVVGNVS